MVKCINCHQKVDSIDEKGLCQDCAEAFSPQVEYKPTKVSPKFNGLNKVS